MAFTAEGVFLFFIFLHHIMAFVVRCNEVDRAMLVGDRRPALWPPIIITVIPPWLVWYLTF